MPERTAPSEAGADEVVLAVDGSKLAGRALAVAVKWERIDLLVTDLRGTSAWHRTAGWPSCSEIEEEGAMNPILGLRVEHAAASCTSMPCRSFG